MKWIAIALAMASAARGQSPGTGGLEVSSTPPAEIWIDGTDTGKTTPLHIELKAGTHPLRLTLPDGRAWGTNVNITPGKTASISWTFRHP